MRHERHHPERPTRAAADLSGRVSAGVTAEPRTLTAACDAPMMSVYSRATARWPPLDSAADAVAARGSAFDTDGPQSGYGAFVSVSSTAPGLLLPLLPFQDRFQSLQNILAVPNMVTVICYTRDQGRCGRIALNSEVRTPVRSPPRRHQPARALLDLIYIWSEKRLHCQKIMAFPAAQTSHTNFPDSTRLTAHV